MFSMLKTYVIFKYTNTIRISYLKITKEKHKVDKNLSSFVKNKNTFFIKENQKHQKQKHIRINKKNN